MTIDAFHRLVDALQNPQSYPHPVETIDVLETHISCVVLTGRFAYKIKKPVDLGFVDFSTFERRRLFCDEELRLNRRLAPDLYEQVVPITGSVDDPHVGGSGTPIEYCVRMRQFPQDVMLVRQMAAGRVEPRHFDGLASQITEFHGRAPAASSDARFGDFEAIAEPMRSTLALLEKEIGGSFGGRIEQLAYWTDVELDKRRDDIMRRKQDGFVRECHGDMHLGNMILDRDAITVFDCIEFNENLRWIDVLSEIAFCTMDLAAHSQAGLGRRFLNRYLELSGDYGGLSAFRLYSAYRAMVRAKVLLLQKGQQVSTRQASLGVNADVKEYIATAETFASAGPPFLAITHGVSGSGKTWGSQQLIEQTGAIRVRSDVERKRVFGISKADRTESSSHADIYSVARNDATYARLAELASTIVRSGFSVIVDATFLKRRERNRFRTLAEQLDVSFFILDFHAPEPVCRERIRLRSRAGLDASEATEDVLNRQLESAEPLAPDEQPAVISVDSDQAKSFSDAARLILIRQ